MVYFLGSDASPFLVLWYLFVAFFGVVMFAHLLSAGAGWMLRRRVRNMLKAHTQEKS